MTTLIILKLNGYFWLPGEQQLLYFLMNLRCKLAHLWDNVLAIPSLFTVGVQLLRHLSFYGVAVGQGKLIYLFERVEMISVDLILSC